MIKQVISLATLLSASIGTSFAGNMGATTCPQAAPYKTGVYVGASIGPVTNVTSLPSAYKGLEGTLSIGAGYLTYQNVYIAAEFFGGSSSTSKNLPYQNSAVGSVRSSWGYGFDILPGVMITDTVLGYTRFGFLRTNFNDVRTSKTGLQVGLGAQTNIYKNLDLRGEYIYSQYGSIANIGRPLVDQFNIGLVYKFV